jgi:hypothetical protein
VIQQVFKVSKSFELIEEGLYLKFRVLKQYKQKTNHFSSSKNNFCKVSGGLTMFGKLATTEKL